MAKIDYTIYDTALFGTTANTDHDLFTIAQGGASNKGKTITNMRGNSQFPVGEAFTIHKIGVTIDDVLTDDDIQGLFLGSTLELIYNNTTVFLVPTAQLSYRNAVQGIKTEASASAFDFFGLMGDGHEFKAPLTIQGGKNFRGILHQGLAVDNASMDIKVMLIGMLDSPNINLG